MGLSPEDIATIVHALQESDWDEAIITVDGARIAVARNGARLDGTQERAGEPRPTDLAATRSTEAAPRSASRPSNGPVPARQAPPPDSVASADETTVTAPSVGVFWSSPEPGSAPFVGVGDRVEAGAMLCIVEVMKLMTNVVAPSAGTIASVLVANGENVEYGTPLFVLRQD